MKVEPVRPCCFFDISIADIFVGRVVLELFEDLAPKTTECFLKVCNGSATDESGKAITYKGNCFHTVIKNFVIQGGDLIHCTSDNKCPNDQCGTSFTTLFKSDDFKPENLAELNESFKVCMTTSTDSNSITSQFFITTHPQPHLNGKYTVFGQVIHGKSVIREIEDVKTENNIPIESNTVCITDCGEWNETMPVPIANACYDSIGGDVYEEFPDDDTHIDKESSELVYIASTIIKHSAGLIFKQGRKRDALLKYKKCLRYVMEYIPDEDQEPDWNKKYQELRKQIYLNLSLVSKQLDDNMKAVDYATYVIDMANSTDSDRAKAYFRRGSSLLKEKKYDSAMSDLKVAKSLTPNDPLVEKELETCMNLIESKKRKEKSQYAKFFGS